MSPASNSQLEIVMDTQHLFITTLGHTTLYLVLFTIYFLLAKHIKDFFSPLDIDDEMTERNNNAVSIAMCGYYFAATLIFIGAVYGPSKGLQHDLLAVSGYSILGLLLLNLSRYINDKFIFSSQFSIPKMCQQRNAAVGAAQLGAYVATGLIAAAAVSGQGGGATTSIVFFILGQFSLLLFNKLYDFITPFIITEELEKKNTACGVALAGTLIALGLIIANGIRGDFVGWQIDLTDFVIAVAIACFFLPLVRLFMNGLIIPRSTLTQEIHIERNIGAGMLEAIVAISFSLVLTQIV